MDDIINRLLPFIHDEMRMPAGMINDVIEEIERLREQVKDCENDFEILSQIFNEVRAERDQMRADND